MSRVQEGRHGFANETVFITETIKVHKGRGVICFGIPGAYLRADCSAEWEKFMLLKGQLSELMVLVGPNLYKEYVTYSASGVPILCVKMKKALYGL